MKERKYVFSAEEINQMIKLCHCKVFDINLKKVILHLKTYLETRDRLPGLFFNHFSVIIGNFFEYFFKRANFNQKPLYLYRNSLESNVENGICSLHQYNGFMKNLLVSSKKDSFVHSNNYFLVVEASFVLKKRNKRKIYFKNSQDFQMILIKTALEDWKSIPSCWLRFKNYFPRRKGDKKMENYSCFRMKSIDEVTEFITNSGDMFERINEKLSEIRVKEAFESLCANYVIYQKKF